MLMIKQNTKKQRGFNLIEVMVSLVIFSIGLLGLAGLQQVGLTQNTTAMQRTVAMNLAYDLFDRMRNNKTTDYSLTTWALIPNCVDAPCNATQIANYDVTEWQMTIMDALPSARGFITGSPASYTVSIGWDEKRLGLFPTSCSPAAPAGIKCISIEGRP